MQEAECSATRGGVIDNLCYEGVVIKEQLVANTDFSCWFDKHIPQTHVSIQLTQQEYLNLCICLLLAAIQTCWHNLGIIEYKGIALVKEIEDVTELQRNLISFFITYALTLAINLVKENLSCLALYDDEVTLIRTLYVKSIFLTSVLNHMFTGVRIERYISVC